MRVEDGRSRSLKLAGQSRDVSGSTGAVRNLRHGLDCSSERLRPLGKGSERRGPAVEERRPPCTSVKALHERQESLLGAAEVPTVAVVEDRLSRNYDPPTSDS